MQKVYCICRILELSGELNDNGVIRSINPGDRAMYYDGEFHAVYPGHYRYQQIRQDGLNRVRLLF